MDNLNQDTFERYASRTGVSFVLFGASHCRPSRAQEEEFRSLVHDGVQTARFARMDALMCEEAARQMQIRLLPTTLVFSNGEIVARLQGFRPRHHLEAMLAKLAPPRLALAA